MALDIQKQGIPVTENTTQALRASGGEPPQPFYGIHTFKKGDIATLREFNGISFPVIGQISAERLVNLNVAKFVISEDKKLYQYEIIKDCKVEVSHGGVQEFVRQGKVEARNKTEYKLV
jgi:hypothetical protein